MNDLHTFEPRAGDFELVRMGGNTGRLIRLGQFLNGDGFLDYEHAKLYLGDGKVIEALPGGAQVDDYVYDASSLWSTGIIKLTDIERKRIILAGYAGIGIPYSEADYFALAAHRLHLELITPGLREYVRTSRHMICSQLVDYFYQKAGIQLFDDGRWNGYVTPADLANLLFRLLNSQEKHVV